MDKMQILREKFDKIKSNKALLIVFNTVVSMLIFSICNALCYLLDYFKINDLNFMIIYVLGVLLVSVITNGFSYSLVFAIVSVFAYNFFFTVPRFSLKFNDKMYIVTFILMLAVGVSISTITFLLKKKMNQINSLNLEKNNLKNEAEKEQLKATLLRSISHDLRTPLTTIKNGAEVLLTSTDVDKEDENEILSDIVLKSDWTIRLVENLLSLTRIDSKNMQVNKALEAVDEVVPQAIRNMKAEIGDRKLYVKTSNDILLVPMDATLIIQVIDNILSNAIKYTKDDGNITIEIWNTGKNAVFRIANDGEAIAEEDLPHIFDMYYTKNDCHNQKGVGLGLAICKLIIKAHGGEITARNSNDKVIVEFTLPMEEENG